MSFPMPDDYTVRLVDLPVSVGGRIEEGPDGHLDVYINARLSSVGQHTAAYHEWEHWLNDDLHSNRDIREVEGHVPSRKPGKLPPLMRARDLMPPPPRPRPAAPDPEPVVSPTPPKRPAPQPRTWLSDYEWVNDILFKLPYREDYMY